MESVYHKPMLRKKEILILDGVLLSLFVLLPYGAKLLLAIPTDCYFQGLGFLCPGCGGTRCVILLFQGRIGESFYMNPYFFLTGIGIMLGILLLNISCFSKRCVYTKLCRWLIHPRSAVVWAIGFVIFGILRNIIS